MLLTPLSLTCPALPLHTPPPPPVSHVPSNKLPLLTLSILSIIVGPQELRWTASRRSCHFGGILSYMVRPLPLSSNILSSQIYIASFSLQGRHHLVLSTRKYGLLFQIRLPWPLLLNSNTLPGKHSSQHCGCVLPVPSISSQ